MSRDPCDGCGRDVEIAGGVDDLWSFGGSSTGGLTLELADGSEHFLCFDCIEHLPDEPDAGDVAVIERRED